MTNALIMGRDTPFTTDMTLRLCDEVLQINISSCVLDVADIG
jgi:hypothetical protein